MNISLAGRRELRHRPVDRAGEVNLFETPINQPVWSGPAALADLLAKIPLGRMGRTDEIASMAAVLCSDAASCLTGTTVMVDGAMTDSPAFARGG